MYVNREKTLEIYAYCILKGDFEGTPALTKSTWPVPPFASNNSHVLLH